MRDCICDFHKYGILSKQCKTVTNDFRVGLYLSGTYPESSERMRSELDLTGGFRTINLLTRFSTFSLIFTYNFAFFVVFAVRGRLFAGIRSLVSQTNSFKKKIYFIIYLFYNFSTQKVRKQYVNFRANRTATIISSSIAR